MAYLSKSNNIWFRLKCMKPCIFLTRNLMSKQLVYNEFGDPLKVVKFREYEVPPLKRQEVLVRMLASPVNPADINTIQGKYPVKVSLPCVAGNEGVGIVEEIGSDVKDIRPGDKVISVKPGQGTWSDIAVFDKAFVKIIPENLGLVEAATLTVNPCTAYRMLTDFQPVNNDLVVIQNGANSACGQNVIQICKAWGVKSINIVRNRQEIGSLKKYLESLGATIVLTEEELRSTNIFKDKIIEKPSLALNCVGGKSSLEMLRHLTHSGKMVTYGGMSREPVNIPTSAFIFKNLSFYGYWMTAWNKKATEIERNKMYDDVINMMCENKIIGPIHKMVKFQDYEEALGNALSPKGFTGCKIPILPQLPCIPGDEGVGEVVEVHNSVGSLKLGDRVILNSRLLGAWRYYGIYNENDIKLMTKLIPLAEASMISISPCMAYRMLEDFRELYPGDTVIQNAANSPCGQCVVQICKAMGVNTFNIVANHCGYETVKKHLLEIGATAVYTLEEAEDLCCFNTSLARPVLGLNCLGGRFEDVILRLLQKNSTMVYYGCAFDIPIVKNFVRRDIQFHKFHLSKWDAHAKSIDKDVMRNKIIQLIVAGKFVAPLYQLVELRNFNHAFANTASCEAFATVNYVFDCTLP